MRLLAAIVLTLFCLLGRAQAAMSLQEQLCRAEAGSYVVTEQDKNYSLLMIRAITSDTLLLEEISVPANQIDLSKYSWKSWLEKKAPGHTAWTFYQINLATSTLEEAYSYTKKCWLILEEEQFLTKLFALPLHPLPTDKRKRIGPAPSANEIDRRALWTPPLFVDGIKMTKPRIEAYETRWPNDNSKLSGSPLELYFSPLTPFPVWIEVKSPHYTFKLRAVDSGRELFSPISFKMPLRPPQFISMQRLNGKFRLLIKSPAYFEKLNLFAIDATNPSSAIPITYVACKGADSEQLFLDIDHRLLDKIFEKNHRYQWVLVPEDASDIYIEAEESFIWK